MKIFKASAFLLLLLIGRATGQDTVIRSQTTVVLAPTLVKDTKGKILWGLKAEDFVILDDGVEQTVKLDETVETEPVFLVVAIQRGGAAYHEFARMQGLSSMLGPVLSQPGTQVAIVEFDSKVELVRDFTANENTVRNELKRLQPGDGGAAILDAVDFSIKQLDKAPAQSMRALLIVSETRDHGSKAQIKDLVTLAGNNTNMVVYTLAFSPGVSNVLDTMRGNTRNQAGPTPNLLGPLIMASQAMKKNIPKAIALMTGGEYGVFKSQDSFEMRLTDFDNHLRDRYLLSFQPKDPHPGLHQIQVKLPQTKGATLLTRSSYWVPEK